MPSRRTHLQVTASLETLLGLSGAPAAEMEFSLPISAKAVERLACDCSVTRNLVLLCYRHHWMVHEGEWQIVRSDDGCIYTVPPLIGFGPRPRGPD